MRSTERSEQRPRLPAGEHSSRAVEALLLCLRAGVVGEDAVAEVLERLDAAAAELDRPPVLDLVHGGAP